MYNLSYYKRRSVRLLLVVAIFVPPFYILVSDRWPHHLCNISATSDNLCRTILKNDVLETTATTLKTTTMAKIITIKKPKINLSNGKGENLLSRDEQQEQNNLLARQHSDSLQPYKPLDNSTSHQNYIPYGDGSCGDNPDRGIFTDLFSQWLSLAKRHNITYFLTTGTLLGAWRNSDLIPYDRDIDVLVDANSSVVLERLKDARNFDGTKQYDNQTRLIVQEDWRLPYASRRRFKCNGKKVDKYSDHCSFQEPLARLVSGWHHVDIYDYNVSRGYVVDMSEWEKRWRVSDVFPLSPCRFMGFETWCPRVPTVVLNAFYGTDLTSSKVCRNGTWMEAAKNELL